MTTTIDTAAVNQARKAKQLIASSVNTSYDPLVNIDWAAPLEEDKWFVSERFCTLG
jgi:hypothetical protein